jgi:hypothetical protein
MSDPRAADLPDGRLSEPAISPQPGPTGPVFIAGPDRCGKTLLAAILGSHPRLAIPIVGSNMWTYFYGQHGDLRDDQNLQRCIDALLAYKHVAFMEPDVERLKRDASDGPRTYAHVFSLFHQQFAERAGKPRWGDQTGLLERYADEVFRAHPDGRMIHMVRDPRDRYEASLALWPDGRGRAGGQTARWRYSMALAARNMRRHAGRYQLVRYEDLVRDPEGVARDVCAFIGERFEASMLRMGDAPSSFHRKMAGGDPLPADPATLISDAFVGRYREVLRPEDVSFIEMFAGPQLTRLGYERDHPRLPRTARLRFVVLQVPVDLARFWGWLGLERLQHLMPGLVGRTPAAQKVLQG